MEVYKKTRVKRLVLTLVLVVQVFVFAQLLSSANLATSEI